MADTKHLAKKGIYKGEKLATEILTVMLSVAVQGKTTVTSWKVKETQMF